MSDEERTPISRPSGGRSAGDGGLTLLPELHVVRTAL